MLLMYFFCSEIAKNESTTQMTGLLEMRKLKVGVRSDWKTRWKVTVFHSVLLRIW